MNIIIKSLLVSLLISSLLVHNANCQATALVNMLSPVPTVITTALGFGTKIHSVSKENNVRFWQLKEFIDSLADLSQTDVTKYSSEITMALKGAVDRYNNMILDMRTICAFNREFRDDYLYYVESSQNRADLRKEVDSRLEFLTPMVEETLNETEHARDVVKQIHAQITAISGKLTYIKEKFNSIASQKRAQLADDIVDEDLRIKNAEWKFLFITVRSSREAKIGLANKEVLIKKVELLNKFIDDTKAYIDWLEQTATKLRQAAQVRGEDASEMWGTAKGKKKVTETVDKIVTEDEDTEDLRKYVFSAIDKAVNDIADQSEAFIKNTDSVRSIRNKRSVNNEVKGDLITVESAAGREKNNSTNADSYKIVVKKVNIMVAFPVDKVLEAYKSANKSLPYQDEKTVKKAGYASVFFETGLDFLETLRVIYETTNRDLVREIEKISVLKNKTVNAPEMHATVAQLSEHWRDSLLEMRRLGVEFKAYLRSNEQDYLMMPESLRRRLMLPENTEPVKRFVENKTNELVDKLRNLESLALKPISNLVKELNSKADAGLENNNVYFGSEGLVSMPVEKIAKELVSYFTESFEGDSLKKFRL